MKSVKVCGAGLMALISFGALATPALATGPTLKLLSGESFPVTAEALLKTTLLETTSASKLESTEGKAKLEWTSGSLAKATLTFSSVKENKTTSCKTEGESSGVVLLKSEALLAYTSPSPLLPAILLTTPLTRIECKEKVLLNGTQVGSLSGFDTGEVTSFALALKGSKGKPSISEYINSEEKSIKPSLLANFGSGNQTANFNVEGEPEFKTNKMVAISPLPKVEFDAEKGWHGEASGETEFDLAETARVKCAKQTIEGVSPSSGDASTSEVAPTFSECHMLIEEEGGKTIKETNATVSADGCDYEFLKSEEPSKGDFDSGFDISKCTGGTSGGITITDSELEAGKTCTVRFPDQDLGTDDESTDTKEVAPFESKEDVNASGVEDEVKTCPAAIESHGPLPIFLVRIVMAFLVIGLFLSLLFI